MTRRLSAALLPVALAVATPAAATKAALALPPGRLADVAATLGRQAGIILIVDDPALWQWRTPALKGDFTVEAALGRLLARSGARAERVGAAAWRIRRVTGQRPPGRAAKAPPPPPIVVADESGTIVVTASKRDVRLRDFAGAVSVLDGDDLTLGGPPDTGTILSRLATVSSTHLGAGRNKLFIRGIADSSFTGPTQATVGQYFGDIRLTYNAPDPDLRLYDVGSVEVLEGPQGTLYGAGSLGGIIRLVPNAPVPGRVGGAIDLGASAVQHGSPGADLSAMINLPLHDRAALRAVGYAITDGGDIDNPLRGRRDVNRTTTAGGRATMRLDAGDGWTIDIAGIVQDTNGRDSQYADRGGARLTRLSPVAEGFDASYRLGELVVSKDWGGLHFRSTTGLVGQELDERFDATPPGGAPQIFAQHNRTRLFSSEARLWQPLTGRLGWVIGASVLRNTTALDRALGPRLLEVPTTGVVNRVRELTLYGEASLRLTGWLMLSGGGRVAASRLTGAADTVAPALGPVEAAARVATLAARKTTSMLPSAALVATPAPGLTTYLRYQEGFRPGGLAIDSGFVRRFRNDRVATTEGGVRYGAPGRDRFDLAASLSRTAWHDIQADFLDGAGLPSTDNIGNGRIWSLAASGGWSPRAGLRLDASIALNYGRVTKPSASYRAALASYAEQFPLAGTMNRIPNVARFSGRIGFDWQRRLDERLTLRVNGWGRYVGRSRLGVGPVLGEAQGDYADSALAARVGTASLGVTLGITNLSDSVGNRFALGTPFAIGRDHTTPLRPRTIRLGFDANF